MRRTGVLGWAPRVALALVLGWPPPAAAQRTDRCVDCHGRLTEASSAGHGFSAWRSSPHAAAGVGCEACHGGDPSAPDREAAHRGILRSADRASLVYFTRIPETCGRCHASELGYFRSSVHFARLRSDGRGPNCVTCHGSMATMVLGPDRALRTCSACHVAGGVAPVEKANESARVLSLVRAENILFDVVQTASRSAPAARAARARPLLERAGRHLSAAAEVWHGFRLDSAVQRLAAAREDIVSAWMALGHARPSEGRPTGHEGPEN